MQNSLETSEETARASIALFEAEGEGECCRVLVRPLTDMKSNAKMN